MEQVRVSEVALLGGDFQDVRPSLQVAEGDQVKIGQTLFTDRHDETICFVSPVTGTVEKIERGARRSLSRLVVKSDPKNDLQGSFRIGAPKADSASIRDALLASGLWPAFIARPFGNIPNPASAPACIFVNAVRRTPDAPDPGVVVHGQQDAFALGVARLTELCEGPVHLCQSARGSLLKTPSPRIEVTRFSGTFAAALSGTHVHRLAPSIQKDVWCINYQDVIALGHLAGSGEVPQTRIISVSGSHAQARSVLRAPLGASLRELTAGRFSKGKDGRNAIVLSGDPIDGKPSAHLSRSHLEINIEVAAINSGSNFSSQSPRPIIPTAALIDALPFGGPALPIMRALSIADFETATALVCDKMLEEDVAALNHLCASGSDYRPLLRAFLNQAQEAHP